MPKFNVRLEARDK